MSKITLQVKRDKDNIPEHISWKADDAEVSEPTECKAFLLALFEKDSMDTIKLDLWTKEMMVEEMQLFFYHSLRAMGNTYYNATQDAALANDFQKFVQYFGEQSGVIKAEE